jgi:hypothetical protein
LSREPQNALAIEGRGVEIGAGEFLRQRKKLHCLGGWIESRDGVLPAVGDPCGTIGADNNTVRCRARAKRYLSCLPAFRIEDSECALKLRRVPNVAVRRWRNVVRVRAARNFKVGYFRGRRRVSSERHGSDCRQHDRTHIALQQTAAIPLFHARDAEPPTGPPLYHRRL